MDFLGMQIWGWLLLAIEWAFLPYAIWYAVRMKERAREVDEKYLKTRGK